MTFRPCVSGCGHFLASGDGHNCCITCMGMKHAMSAFMDESGTHHGKMTITELQSRLQYLKSIGAPLPLHCSNPPRGATSGSSLGDLRFKVMAGPSGNQPPRPPHSSALQLVELPEERLGHLQRSGPHVSFGIPCLASSAMQSRALPSSSRLPRTHPALVVCSEHETTSHSTSTYS